MPEMCTFSFGEKFDGEIVETQLALAVISAECAFGQAAVRIGAAYSISEEKGRVAIDVSTDAGEHIAKVFAGLVTRQFGEDGFTVERAGGKRG